MPEKSDNNPIIKKEADTKNDPSKSPERIIDAEKQKILEID